MTSRTQPVTLRVDPGGQVRSLYHEVLDLSAMGVVTIRRASHVEPDDGGRWWADLSPVDGPTLGPFSHRSTALDAEARWLQRHRL